MLFGLFFTFQVLEHFDNPDLLFKQISFLAADRANGFVTVPNPAARIAYNEVTGTRLDMPPNRISCW
jgi:hypothetical protein